MKRVVITGIGLLTPLGNEPGEFFRNAMEGVCGIRSVRKFDASKFPVRIGGEIDLGSEQVVFRENAELEMSNVAKWAVIAARKAVKDANLDIGKEDPYGIDVILGTSLSPVDSLLTEYRRDSGMTSAKPVIPVLMNPASSAIQVSRDLGLFGETANLTTACSSASSAIGYAARLVSHGESTCILTGGADEGVSKLFMGTLGNSTGLSHRNDDPSHAFRPFDRNRDGYVVGDASCVLVLEEYERAKARGARIYCEILGYAGGSDASSAFKLAKSDEPGARTIERALQRAEVAPEAVDYYCAVGVADPWLDIRETRMIKRVFGMASHRMAISSIKPMTGHPMGASGAIQTAISALAVRFNGVPPTINCDDPDPECDLDYVPNCGRSMPVRKALVYTIGNTTNTALLLAAC